MKPVKVICFAIAISFPQLLFADPRPLQCLVFEGHLVDTIDPGCTILEFANKFPINQHFTIELPPFLPPLPCFKSSVIAATVTETIDGIETATYILDSFASQSYSTILVPSDPANLFPSDPFPLDPIVSSAVSAIEVKLDEVDGDRVLEGTVFGVVFFAIDPIPFADIPFQEVREQIVITKGKRDLRRFKGIIWVDGQNFNPGPPLPGANPSAHPAGARLHGEICRRIRHH